MKIFFLFLVLVFFNQSSKKPLAIAALAGAPENETTAKENIITGAEQTHLYLPYLKGKRIGILGNQTSIIANRHLVDSLKALGIKIVTVFGPEHGFRGNASNGDPVKDEFDSATGIPIVSLYGPKQKPTKKEMASIDLMIFDLQDVGCRFLYQNKYSGRCNGSLR